MATRAETRKYAANPADLPRGTLVGLFLDTVERFADSEAFRYKDDGGDWHSISYAEAAGRVRHLMFAFRALGLERGERVGILSENRPEWALSDYAALCHGAVDVPIYPTLPPDQIAYILRDSGARLVFVSTDEQLAKVQEVRGELDALERIIVFDDVASDDRDVLTFRQVLDLGRREAEAVDGDAVRDEVVDPDPDDVATILYTSGTTGRPKGVMLTHNNIFSNTRAVDGVLSITPEDVALSLLPLSHIFERMVDYYLFSCGCTIAYAESIATVPDNLVEVEPTIVASVPRLYEKIHAAVQSAGGIKGKLVRWATGVGRRWADARLAGERLDMMLRIKHGIADRLVFRKLRAKTGGRLRFFISGGAPLGAEIARFFYSAGILILEGYGLTETSPVTNVNRPDAFRFGTVGKPVPGTEEMIAEDGELLVRGPQVMKGYFHLEDETRATIDEDGWLHTGDIGTIDRDGFLRITDRKKDVIVTAGGKNIAPQPIENRAKRNRFVAEAVMTGDRRPYPVILIAPDFDALEAWAGAEASDLPLDDRAALIADERVRAKMESEVFGTLEGFARYETPKKIALLPRELSIDRGELTPTLKVRRHVVEERFRDEIERLYDNTERVVAN